MQRPQVTGVGVAESNNPGPERVEHVWAPSTTRATTGVLRVLEKKQHFWGIQRLLNMRFMS